MPSVSPALSQSQQSASHLLGDGGERCDSAWCSFDPSLGHPVDGGSIWLACVSQKEDSQLPLLSSNRGPSTEGVEEGFFYLQFTAVKESYSLSLSSELVGFGLFKSGRKNVEKQRKIWALTQKNAVADSLSPTSEI